MRDYVLSQSQSNQAYGRWTVVARILRNAKRRRELIDLLKLDDLALARRHISRALVVHLLEAPRETDLDWEQSRLSR
jgi:hypothetical protein